MSSVTVRQANGTENVDVVAVKRAAILDDAAGAYSAAQVTAWAPDEADLEDVEAALSSDRYLALVAEVDGRVVGFGILEVERGSLLALYVDPDHRGTGIGSTLLGHIESSARLKGADRLDLLAARNAVGFYEDNGYERTGTVDREVDGETLTFVAMETEL